jgi:hypothetical protein
MNQNNLKPEDWDDLIADFRKNVEKHIADMPYQDRGKLSRIEDDIADNIHVRQFTITWFKGKKFNADWEKIERIISWENNIDSRYSTTDYTKAFTIIKEYIIKTPTAVSNKLINNDKKTGIFEMKFLKKFETFTYGKDYHKVDKLVQFIQNFKNDMTKDLMKLNQEIQELDDQIKKEEEKDYSELKYELADQYDMKAKEYRKLYNAFLEEMMLSYYKETGDEMLTDMRFALKWLKENNIQHRDVIHHSIFSLYTSLSQSKMGQEIENSLKNLFESLNSLQQLKSNI